MNIVHDVHIARFAAVFSSDPYRGERSDLQWRHCLGPLPGISRYILKH
jgi:hypothetical protein